MKFFWGDLPQPTLHGEGNKGEVTRLTAGPNRAPKSPESQPGSLLSTTHRQSDEGQHQRPAPRGPHPGHTARGIRAGHMCFVAQHHTALGRKCKSGFHAPPRASRAKRGPPLSVEWRVFHASENRIFFRSTMTVINCY